MHSLFKAHRHGSSSYSFTCKLHHACLSFVSVHQMAPPLTKVADTQMQLTIHLSTAKRWKAELAWLVHLYRTVYSHKWSVVRYRSSAATQDRESFAGERPTFYRCATQPYNTRCWHVFSQVKRALTCSVLSVVMETLAQT